ncbi:hypothetical protein RJ640_029340 [Escallonia rubra]|uniref:GPI inositol-deacylase n=1 Tax=Escallonia rubra TaxID=112253 RepID=A0AA88R9Y1_9ASTE|nr:hypothetical protein RJ640_029340 [Escallonia rubra]
MQGLKAKLRVSVLVTITIGIGVAAIYGLLKPVSNGCNMTYMYPTYIPLPSPENVSSAKYGLYLYHEGWKKIDFNEHLKKLSGVPVLFVPGNGGSYKQVRSLAAESDRAYQGGPLENTFYQEASLTLEEGGVEMDVAGLSMPSQYSRMLDWFAVDLEGEHSAMDGRILEEHTEYVVYAIHRILDQYKESRDARVAEGAAIYGSLPKTVLLVGHSMGGFVARAAVVHPHLRKTAVETILTLSTPHQSPPVALQPSLGQYYARINQEWRKGYEVHTSQTGHSLSSSLLTHVVVVSISGGVHDYQVRSQLESLDGIVPPTHGFMIGSTEMKNVWLSMEHQVILWCNQLVVQVSHTLLSLVNSESRHPLSDATKRLAVFAKMLRSGIPESWLRPSRLPQQLAHVFQNEHTDVGSQVHKISACPTNVRWGDDGLERDLYIRTTSVTVLAMDGRRRWLDIKKLGSNGKSHFIFVTNLAPCSGVRLHLWPEKRLSASDTSVSKRFQEVTSKMVQVPSGPAPRQIEPGSQTEQAPPSSIFWLDSKDMHGYRFLTISVAPRPAVSGRPPPAASMAVGQFFNPEEGKREFSPHLLLGSMFSQKGITLKEDHSLAFNLSFGIGLGLLPVKVSLKTIGCGIKISGLPAEEVGDMENSRLCKLRCFPPVALAWDATSGLRIFPNLYSETIVVDSSPALWNPSRGSEKTAVLLLVDPHCSYRTSIAVSPTAAALRFMLLYCSQIIGLSFAVVFFALMRQANAWELDFPIPSMLSAVESNLRMPLPFIFLAISPTFISLFYSCLSSQPYPPVVSFLTVSIICYLLANGSIIMLVAMGRKFLLFVSSLVPQSLHQFLVIEVALVSFVHPALGLFILMLSHSFCCHIALCSSLTASFRSHARNKEVLDFGSEQSIFMCDDGVNKGFPVDENCSSTPDSARSYSETQLEIFHHRHGLLILHFLATVMFVPSLVACLQRIGAGQNFPWLLDSALCIGVILHGICDSKPEFNFFLFPLSGIPGWEARLSFAYLLAGYCSFLFGLALAPYRVFYAMAAIGVISFVFRVIERRNRERGEAYHSSRKHSHRH